MKIAVSILINQDFPTTVEQKSCYGQYHAAALLWMALWDGHSSSHDGPTLIFGGSSAETAPERG